VTWIILEAMELYPGSYYEARLRVQMAMLKDDVVEEERPEGQWSEWSQPVCFLSPQRPGGCCVVVLCHGLGWASSPLSFLLPLLPSPPWSPLSWSLRHLGLSANGYH
jgi:hypothetical protein